MIVIDVSEYQKNILASIKNRTIPCDGIIARVTKKSGAIDEVYYNTSSIAKDLGVPFGAYKLTYAEHYKDAITEANRVFDIIKTQNLKLGFWLDMETQYLRNNKYAIADVYNAYHDVLGDRLTGVYCDTAFYTKNIDVLKDKRLWLANWSKKPDYYNDDNVVGWQYTDKYNGVNMDASYWKIPVDASEVVKYNPDNVRLLQNYLNRYYGYNLVVDGVMGTKTFTAICQTIAK